MKYLKTFENIQRIKQMMGLVLESDGIKYTDPNFDVEWGEAKRYVNHPNLGKKIEWTKEDWINKVRSGKVMKFSEIESLENISDPNEFEALSPEKIERFISSFDKKEIELPIAVKFPNGTYDLIAGNTRVTGLRSKGYDPLIWVFEL